jgi:iron complex outermembrane recepter protein
MMKIDSRSKIRCRRGIACAAVAFTAGIAHSEMENSANYSISSPDLGTALTELGQQSNREFYFSADLTRGKRVPPLQGNYTIERALDRLLSGSGLIYRVSNNGSIVVERDQQASPPTGKNLAGSAAAGNGSTEHPTDEAASGLSEIVVTAERRTQRLQDVPISATVLSAADLNSKGVNDLADVQQVAPSVAINTYNRSTFVNIRGVGIAQSGISSSPGVAFYIDGQLIPHEFSIGLSFYDVGSIEVLRGPQGTLTGQNSTGGAIYIRTPEPTFGGISGYIDQSAANFDWYKTVAALNLGLNDNVAIRIAGVHDERDSFTRNIGSSPSTPGDSTLDAARMNIALRSDDEKLHANVRGEYFDSRTDNIAVKNRNDAITSDPFVIEEDAISYFNTVGYRANTEVHYELNDMIELRASTSWQDSRIHDEVDGDRTTTAPPRPGPGRVTIDTLRIRDWANEVDLVSTGAGPFQWVLGGFLLKDRVNYEQDRDQHHTVRFISATQSVIADVDGMSKSVFGQATYRWDNGIELLAGARNSWDHQTAVSPVTVFTPALTSVQATSAVTGKFGVNYHVNRDLMYYATASKGYKAGGTNTNGPNVPNYKPEENYVYEAGVKTTLVGNTLRINADVFDSDYKNIQYQSVINGITATQNAAAGRTYGAELEITSQFDNLAFNFGGSYLHATFAENVCLNNTFNPAGTTGCSRISPAQGDSLVPKGSTLPFSPTWTFNAGVQYTLQFGQLELTPRVQWSHLSSQLATPFPRIETRVPGHDVLDARLSFVNKRLTVEGFVTNLTDERYIASQIQDAGSAMGGILYGAPRQYGVRAIWKFGG